VATVTLTNLATAAALDMGGIDPGEGLNSTQLALLLTQANQMLASWSIDQRFILSLLVTGNLTLTSGTLAYTIGTGQNFNIARPAAIISATAFVTSAASTAYAATGDPRYAEGAAGSSMAVPLKILTAEEFSDFPDRALRQVFPKGLFYDRGNAGSPPVGNVFIVPINLGGTLEIVTWSPLPQFVDATTTYTLPDPAYAEMMEYGLALRSTQIFPGVQIPDWVKVGYDDASKRVMTLNAQLVGAQGMQPAASEPAAAEAK
jgi:hypothetical protein